ncbi:MAG: metallophosphoesterase [Deltaproteobacteria bacterium]|nr:metallophosphoesterase [Deltaproteobacteria bacterium]
MIRIAAVGDLHYDRLSRGRLAAHLGALREVADVLLLAGDLTQVGHVEEAYALADDLAESPVPVVAVFGNHDFHSDQNALVRGALEEAGVTVLEKQACRLEIRSSSVGIVGLKGFGGGFVGACATEFGEPETKAFVRTTKAMARYLHEALLELDTDYRIALLHYSPISGTLHGEKREIYPFLGSYLLGEAADEGGADIVFHGHAHAGCEKGETSGGVPVRNVAQHVIRHVFNLYSLNKEGIVLHQGLVPHARLTPSHAPDQ